MENLVKPLKLNDGTRELTLTYMPGSLELELTLLKVSIKDVGDDCSGGVNIVFLYSEIADWFKAIGDEKEEKDGRN